MFYIFCINNFIVRPKKSSLVSRSRPGEIFLSVTRPHSRMCIRIYILNFKQQQKKKKIKNQKKQKKLKKQREFLRNIDKKNTSAWLKIFLVLLYSYSVCARRSVNHNRFIKKRFCFLDICHLTREHIL